MLERMVQSPRTAQETMRPAKRRCLRRLEKKLLARKVCRHPISNRLNLQHQRVRLRQDFPCPVRSWRLLGLTAATRLSLSPAVATLNRSQTRLVRNDLPIKSTGRFRNPVIQRDPERLPKVLLAIVQNLGISRSSPRVLQPRFWPLVASMIPQLRKAVPFLFETQMSSRRKRN